MPSQGPDYACPDDLQNLENRINMFFAEEKVHQVMFADYLKDLGQHHESKKFFKQMSHDVPLKRINKVKLDPSLTGIMKKSDARVNYKCLSPVLERSKEKP